MSAQHGHGIHPQDAQGTFNPNCEDCRAAIVEDFRAKWEQTTKPGYADPKDLMHKISGWEWANTYCQMPEEARMFSDIIGWFANALEAGRAAGYRQAQDEMRKRLGL